MTKEYNVTVMTLTSREDYGIEGEEKIKELLDYMKKEYGKPEKLEKGVLGYALSGEDWIEFIVYPFVWYVNSKLMDILIEKIKIAGGKKKK